MALLTGFPPNPRIQGRHRGGREREELRVMALMAFRAAAAMTSSPLPPSKQQHHQQQHNLHLSPKLRPAARHPPAPLVPSKSAALSLLAVFAASAAAEAKAFALPKEDIVSSLTKVEDTIGQVQDAGSKALDFSQGLLQALTSVLKPGVDAALPVLKTASQEALKVASPVVTDASKQATEALQSAGVDPSPVLSAAKTVADAAQQSSKIIEGAKPIASATVETISSDPSAVVASAGALFLGYLLLPPIWSAFSYNFRGYKGGLTPAQTLDLLATQNYLLIDIRSEKDKDKSGVPRLPSNAKNKLISIPLEDLPSKIKGLVRNSKRVEAEMVALKISYLKRVSKSSNIVIMDSYSDTARTVAKTLTSLGFGNSWIMTDGFSGSKGWLQSRLGADSYSASFTELVSPSRIIPAAARRGTTRSTSLQSTRKLLPGTIDN